MPIPCCDLCNVLGGLWETPLRPVSVTKFRFLENSVQDCMLLESMRIIYLVLYNFLYLAINPSILRALSG